MVSLIDYIVVLSLSGWMWIIECQDLSGKTVKYSVPDKEIKKVVYGSYAQEKYDPKTKTIYLCPGRFNIEGRRQSPNKSPKSDNQSKRKRRPLL